MMETRKYHYLIGFPASVSSKFGTLKLSYSGHACQAALRDRYAEAIELPASLNTDTARAIEIEVDPETGSVKVVYRVHYDAYHDLCLVVIPSRGFVKTVWLNRKDDCHRTLRREEYCVPERRAA